MNYTGGRAHKTFSGEIDKAWPKNTRMFNVPLGKSPYVGVFVIKTYNN